MMKLKIALVAVIATVALASIAVAGSCGGHAKKAEAGCGSAVKAAKSGCGAEAKKAACCGEDASKCCGAKVEAPTEAAE
jgi:hypothetical protein